MLRQNWEELEKKIEEKQKRRVKRRRPAMKVTGAGVKQLQKIITKK